jgi:integral membrane sensor domain MASE1
MIIRLSFLCAATFAIWMAFDRATVTEINPLMHPVAWVVAAAILGALVGAAIGAVYKLFFRTI